jgi:hypothetical protein
MEGIPIVVEFLIFSNEIQCELLHSRRVLPLFDAIPRVCGRKSPEIKETISTKTCPNPGVSGRPILKKPTKGSI